jgi:hypothetical protein
MLWDIPSRGFLTKIHYHYTEYIQFCLNDKLNEGYNQPCYNSPQLITKLFRPGYYATK